MEGAIKVFTADNFTLTSSVRSVDDAFKFLVVEEGPFNIEERTIKFSVYKDSQLDLLAEVCIPFVGVRTLVEMWRQRDIRG